MKKDEFLQELSEKLNQINAAMIKVAAEDETILSIRPEGNQWNILECIEHLHRYNKFYLPEFQKTLSKAPSSTSNEIKRGRFGIKSAKSMLPTENGVKNPMKTFKSKNTFHSNVGKNILKVFEDEQIELASIVKEAEHYDIGAVRCKTTLPIIRFRLCDALEFVINHQIRHIAQANRILNGIPSK